MAERFVVHDVKELGSWPLSPEAERELQKKSSSDFRNLLDLYKPGAALKTQALGSNMEDWSAALHCRYVTIICV